MRHSSRRVLAVADGIDVILRHLGTLSASPAAQRLRVELGRCLVQVQGWQRVEPTADQYDAVTLLLLKLQREINQLERLEGGGELLR
jgi:hypothetical protein